MVKSRKTKSVLHNHVNNQHKKIDWSIRVFFMVAMVLGF
ncbi:DUF4181 domain-containing protein [Planococcus versutus]